MDELEKLKEHYLIKQRIRGKRARKNLRDSIYSILGHECVKCGFDDKRTLQFDHKNGQGLREVKKFKGNQEMYRYYKHHPEKAKQNLQVLCANCNWIKRAINKENRT